MEERRKREREKERKQMEKDKEKEEKQREKKQKQEEKEKEKKRKKDERQLNKKKSKEECLLEMVVVIDPKFVEEDGGGEITTQLQRKECRVRLKGNSIPFPSISWLRCCRRPGEELEEEVEEDHYLIKLNAQTASNLIQTQSIVATLLEIGAHHPTKKLTLLIEGMDNYLKRKNNDVAKDYRKMVVSHMEGNSEGTSSSSRPVFITKQMVDEALVCLQMDVGCNIRLTNTTSETCDYITRLTAAIAYNPYRPQSTFEGFCAEAMRKKGNGSFTETWINQLAQIHGVSDIMARSIVSEYPTFSSLIRMYENEGFTEKEKELLLQDVRVDNGTHVGRRLGAVISKKIFQIFTEKDPTMILH